EQNLEEEPDNHWNIRHWFEAARRLPDVDIDLAIERLRIWYNKKASIDVLYYLYVLYALEAIEGSRKARTFAERFMQECKQRIVPLQLATQKHSFNWLGRGSGLSSLVHFKEVKSPRSGADWYRDEDGTMLLARIPGVIEHISSPTSGSVELRCGLRVYFTPGFRRHTPGSEEVAAGTFVAPRDLNKEVDFFLGFSYEGLRAYDVAFLARRF
ncbi:MAG: hypothetical protein KC425_00985, partial [Anaerolineales bacterium]|nr:hypothetical protein [Anaerolineales bacterium]